MTNLGDRGLGLLIAALGIAVIYMALQLPEPMAGSHIAYGPGFFPVLLGIATVAAGVALAVFRPDAVENEDAVASPHTGRPRLAGPLLVLLAMLAYIYFSELIGFIPLAAVTLAVLLIFGGMRVLLAIALSLVASVFIYLMFSKGLLVPLPRGLLQPWAIWL
ncbi:tripartite tricarboxylate transporter TctB family protein [Neorhizobium sp. LjRoot104]|uniref:tripartite tricarboxylate transporter TctB family protein n=1 Tax=Neorhizobium sp. LjRoot104 TaxID=3342254 RepID=UPI003ECECBBC